MAKGFNSSKWSTNGTLRKGFGANGLELVRQDLMNHIFTSPGGVPGLPTFGTSIPHLVGKRITQETIETVRRDLKTVVDYDPRVRLLELIVAPLTDKNTLAAKVSFVYIETGETVVWQLDVPL